MNIQLLVIDPQNDFCLPAPEGALSVKGADADCMRLADMISRIGDKLDNIHVTLDSHNEFDIAHPIFWKDRDGNPPNIFTQITGKCLKDGDYVTSDPSLQDWAFKYAERLETSGRYPLCTWPPHCLTGTEGYLVEENVSLALRQWSKDNMKAVNFVTKGENPFTEHYSAIKAEVPDPLDARTWKNMSLLESVEKADILFVAGQALSHCVANTVSDIITALGEEFATKIVLVRDTCSNVEKFEFLGEQFIEEKMKMGMKLGDSVKVLA